jgi:hypothetical protein
LSVDENERAPGALPVSQYVAGFLATIAIFAALVGIVYYPGRVGSSSILVALIAAGIGGFQSRLAAFAVGISTLCWLAGMIVSVAIERPVF